MGLDVGSTTIKAVILDPDENILFEDYRRHHADITGAMASLLGDAADALPGTKVRATVTGSAGLGTAEALGLTFIQEVMAETAAVQRWNPDADVLLELGGEDAKITYLKPVPEQRMNGSCAGGTGAFIDQMATLLHTDTPGLNDLASRAKTIHPIASRCGVFFAKSDLQPLINEGARHEDLAASVLQLSPLSALLAWHVVARFEVRSSSLAVRFTLCQVCETLSRASSTVRLTRTLPQTALSYTWLWEQP